ncbi:FAD-dependent monooxygenase [Microbacterium thalassium]|uniref:2-polyprenyl-6-methoxyphenol hydroxylase-like FAD-dependent oxidoreductase n=1 Tax=Microbacterium thalassium TaxID=362649 RepID=A0A7X0KUX4_9MICO|nr:FAD-dependent monooxygenase [Microbacterium thalassium]MBB6391621.1 2-polyprenyl-6-methoxyphenol hydroxylase-like FAD-dependent oxidoreductase [Microbacterium thalassium]GLK24224.1 FAD-dependent oxidoreductase [Microbacterium thalassium]
MRAVICGAGIAGLAAAIALHRSGWQVTVLEHAPRLRDGGYMIDFFGPGFDAAERIGILDTLRARSHSVDVIDWADPDGHVRARLHYDRMRDAAGGKLISLLRGDVERTLFEALPSGVDLRFSTTVTGAHPRADGVTVDLGGERVEADLLVGADGIHSGIRAQVFGPEERFLRPLGLHTAAWFADSPPAATALSERFVIESAPGKMAGVYGVGGDRVATFLAFTETTTHAPADPLGAIRRRYGDMSGIVRPVLAAEPVDEVYYDLVAQVVMPTWRSGRVILIGDAAYAVSLVAGQGASLALAGGVALGEALVADAALADGDGIDAALAAFEERVRPVVEEKQAGGRRTVKWFVPRTKARVALRNLSMRAADLPILARLLSPALALDTKGFAPVSRPERG